MPWQIALFRTVLPPLFGQFNGRTNNPDLVFGSTGDDLIYANGAGGGAADVIFSGATTGPNGDVIYGGNNNDHSSDLIFGFAGKTTLTNDQIQNHFDNHIWVTSPGVGPATKTDLFNFNAASIRASINYLIEAENYRGMNVYGGRAEDLIVSSVGRDFLRGDLGEDIIYLRGGVNDVWGGDENDRVYGSIGTNNADYVSLGGGHDTYYMTIREGVNVLTDWETADTLILSNVSSIGPGTQGLHYYWDAATSTAYLRSPEFYGLTKITIAQGSQTDLINALQGAGALLHTVGTNPWTGFAFGTSGDDILDGKPHLKSHDGGLGNDTLTYVHHTNLQPGVNDGVRVELDTGTARVWHTDKTITGIENVIGSHYDDFIYGDDFANRLEALGGSDDLHGLDGADTLVSTGGLDNLYGGNGADTFEIVDSNVNRIVRLYDFTSEDTFVFQGDVQNVAFTNDGIDGFLVATVNGTNTIQIRNATSVNDSNASGIVNALAVVPDALPNAPTITAQAGSTVDLAMEQITFDGSANAGATLSSDQPDLTNGLTVSADVTFNSLSATEYWQRVFDFGDGAADDNILLARKGNTNDMWFEVYNDTGQSMGHIEVANAIQVGVEAHWAVSITNNATGNDSAVLYKDGANVGQVTLNGSIAEHARSYNELGNSLWAGDGHLDGTISHLRVFEDTLTQGQIGVLDALSGHMGFEAVSGTTSNVTVTENGQTWSFDGGAGQALTTSAQIDYTDGFTFAADVTFDTFAPGTAWQRVFDFGNGAAQDNILLTREGNTNNMLFEVYGAGASLGHVRISDAIETGVEAHWAVTVMDVDNSALDPDVAKVYKDGVEVAELLFASHQPIVSGTTSYIGTSHWAGNTPFSGDVSDLRIYDRELDNQEISMLANMHDDWMVA